MAALVPLGQTTVSLMDGRHVSLIEVNYTASSDTVAVDPAFYNAGGTGAVGSFHLAGGTAPTLAMNSAPSGGTVDVTITSGSVGRILIVLLAAGQNTSL